MPTQATLDPAEVAFFSDLQTLLSKPPQPLPTELTSVCGVDAAYEADRVFAVAALFQHGQLSKEASCVGRCTLPYVSGLFYLREGPFVVEAVRRLQVRPQPVCFDAHGAAHPRSAGLATICGMLLEIPSVGIAKSRLIGSESVSSDSASLVENGRTIGLITTTEGVSRRFWSPGYSVNLASLRRIMRTNAQTCLRALRQADDSARRARSSARQPAPRPR